MEGQGNVGQMSWRLPGDEEATLRLRFHEAEDWRSYLEFPELMEPDVEDMSLGYPTFIKLLKSGWKLM